MFYFRILLKEIKKRYWRFRCKLLFMKYDRLSEFEYIPGDKYWGDDFMKVGTDDIKHYYLGETKECYNELKYMLNLELKIRYRDTDS